MNKIPVLLKVLGAVKKFKSLKDYLNQQQPLLTLR